MLPILDCHRELVTPSIEVSNDRLESPVAVTIGDVATISVGQQVLVIQLLVRPRSSVRPDAHPMIWGCILWTTILRWLRALIGHLTRKVQGRQARTPSGIPARLRGWCRLRLDQQ